MGQRDHGTYQRTSVSWRPSGRGGQVAGPAPSTSTVSLLRSHKFKGCQDLGGTLAKLCLLHLRLKRFKWQHRISGRADQVLLQAASVAYKWTLTTLNRWDTVVATTSLVSSMQTTVNEQWLLPVWSTGLGEGERDQPWIPRKQKNILGKKI